ncbi:leukotriene A-4 hydrol [Basidiobolus meristosporus CBS 931.73]|uniref:Leukotriene A(4) hydrolase n=1 Tax=Basidiobolus meristosporus CBS 931.73 TaxID=1314790 RepID=A0A1Y1ZCP7_9FUNG|nr:leukotriene A-4 hydrol [Basidiobolus meristosporus CBS 931.73]|eukprot:ORY07969.1 leukotriene A-4 hydrol [Basidiobolus meristosporus CBS 931.73]
MTKIDPNTLANIEEVTTEHLHLDLKVDFEKQRLVGSVLLTLKTLAEQVHEVVLDTNHLVINGVYDGENQEKSYEYKLNEEDPKFGRSLTISLPNSLPANQSLKVLVKYETTKECGALQWLQPSQTMGKEHPYLFTQCEAIHARSLVPCQDSPGVKITYSANIDTPAPLRALMSALRVNEEPEVVGDSRIYKFEQKTTMPSYLIALVVGDLEGREIGPRSTVWSEPAMIEKCAWEFVDTEQFIKTGEELLTPYEWGCYDLLVLPGSFPYGGMENPCLTFVTPTLLAGDRSLVDVVAHEIAHSWMGNLVTTKSWENFWLNEGWTMFIERKIIGRMHGEPSRQFSAQMGIKALEADVDFFGHDNSLTCLCPRLHGVDPDDAFSSVPYEKGFNLLYYLEQHLGGPSVFEPYMKAYVQYFAGKALTTSEWKDFLYQYMEKTHGQEKVDLLNQVDWKAWLHTPGMPPVENKYDQTLSHACTQLAKKWDEHRDAPEASPKDIEDFTPDQKVFFLEKVLETEPLPHSTLEAMDKAYSFTQVQNSEIRFRWQMVCLKAEYQPIYPEVVKFLVIQGRMKYTRPLYRALFKCPSGSQLARDTFIKNRDFYHPICGKLIEKDLGLAN